MKVYRRWGLVLLCLLCLTGCGREEKANTEDGMNIHDADWKANGFAVSGEVQEEQALWASEYIQWQHEDVRGDLSYESEYVWEPGSCSGQIYRFYDILLQGGVNRKDKYLLEVYDTFSMQAAVTEIDSEKLGIDNGFISGMGVMGQGNYVFRVLEYEQRTDLSEQLILLDHYLVYSDLGENTQKVDVLSAYLEMGIADKVSTSGCICDTAGNSYTRAGYSGQPYRDLYILDREGNLLMEHKGEEYDQISEPLRMREGELIFPIFNNREKRTRFVWFDVEKKEERIVASFESDYIKQYGIQGNDIYYESYYGIVIWNIVSGDRKLVYRFDENGVSRLYNTMLVLQEGHLPILRMYATINEEEEDWLVALSDQERELPDVTRIANLNEASSRVQNCVAVASRRNPDYYFTYEVYAETGKDDFRTRIIAEMVAGGGPDILYVSLEDMKLLQSRGMIKDLRTLLPQESLDKILPGIIELGTVDGTFVGLAPEMDVGAVVTLKSIWDQDTWKLEDILTLLDTGNFTGIFCQGTTTFAPAAVLGQLTRYGLQASSLIDWEKGESHFESELFLRILEASATYGDNPLRTDTWLGMGGCLGMMASANLELFDELWEQYGEECYFVGMPTNGSSGNYVFSRGVLVVNANMSDSKAVSAYLECLLRDEIQYPSYFTAYDSILKISLKDVKTTVAWNNEIRTWWKNQRINIREDGTSALNDYKELLESCIPFPETYEDITDIVWEEAQSYIAGDRPAKDVAEIIDKRIQVYLDVNTK